MDPDGCRFESRLEVFFTPWPCHSANFRTKLRFRTSDLCGCSSPLRGRHNVKCAAVLQQSCTHTCCLQRCSSSTTPQAPPALPCTRGRACHYYCRQRAPELRALSTFGFSGVCAAHHYERQQSINSHYKNGFASSHNYRVFDLGTPAPHFGALPRCLS